MNKDFKERLKESRASNAISASHCCLYCMEKLRPREGEHGPLPFASEQPSTVLRNKGFSFLLPHSLTLHLSVLSQICRPGCRTSEQVSLCSLRKSGDTSPYACISDLCLTNMPESSSPRSVQAGPSSLPVSCHQQTVVLWGPRTASKGAKGGQRSWTWKRQLGAGLRPREGQVTRGTQVAWREVRWKQGLEPGGFGGEVRPGGQPQP